jgi:hypothetical protein
VIRSNSNSDTSHFNFLVTSVTDEGNHHHINGTYVSGSAFDSNEIVAFDFFVTGDKGDTGQTGPATQLSVTSTTTGAAGTSASVTVSGTAPNQSLAFTIPQGIQGIQGIQGPTGSSGATALLTGYVSSPGTVAATDTVIQAVGKLNGNDELKAPIASLYPYIGGKLLTYLDEEAAIADPLISAGDIYRKTAGGVDYVNADNVPSLDLRFATDKTLTARRGPTPVFTRGSSGTFVGSNGLIQPALFNQPRFDHDPVTGVCRGLLIEEGRTNLVTYSEDLALAFTTERASIDPNIATAPDGATTADKLVEDTTATNNHRLTRQFNLSAIPYTFSVFAKASERSWIRMTLFDGTTSRQVWFNVSAGTIGTQSGATGQIASFGNGWWRCSITATGLAFVSSQANIALATADNIIAYTGDGTSGIFLWGAQLEAGSFATSYIPTTTGSLARSADVCNITGGDFNNFYNQSEGTMLTNAFTPASGDRTVLAADDNTANEMIRLRTEGTNPFFKVTDGGSELVAIDAGTVSANTSFKLIGAYKLDDFASSINGGAAVTDTSGTIPTVDRMRIGAGQGGNTMCGCVASLRYYKKRLPNAKLAQLTA